MPKGGRGRISRVPGRTSRLAGRRAGHKPGSAGTSDRAERELLGGAARPGPRGGRAGGAPNSSAPPVSGLGEVSVQSRGVRARNLKQTHSREPGPAWSHPLTQISFGEDGERGDSEVQGGDRLGGLLIASMWAGKL